jgi:hypothetical protein
MLSDEDVAGLEWWWCSETGLPIEICDCKPCCEYRGRKGNENMNRTAPRKETVMNVTRIEYKRLVNRGNFEHESLSVEVQLEDGETAHEAVKRAKAFVEAEIVTKHPTESDFASAKNILANPDAYTGYQVKQAQEIANLCEMPEEIPF